MEALRAPGGDAWSAEQTHHSLARYLLEETHEVLETIDAPTSAGTDGALPPLVDELGDLLFQILFHARIGQEEEPAWDVDDVARAFVAKMERRNPHVFGPDADRVLRDRGDVEAIIRQWHAAKAAEQAAARSGEQAAEDDAVPGPRDPFAGIPRQLPALQRAAKAVHRTRSSGDLSDLLARADAAGEELAADPAIGPEGAHTARALLDLVVAAEARDQDPESLLRSLLARLARR
ncbi:tetrapyrrole methyltransferase [Brachybacterium sp. EF45031]|nr:tetrapyrrole methyltransferase [Brachybacterium sillae]